ncbi:adhesion G-protein coupled receptor D1-like [Apostichopus japonicus]|uniref:adhesion G-protein coupled receptor D1-like n=1 Tax=Stichopus japonicus TaxID=307972 RepID=UPI003AB4E8FA
MAPFLWAPFLWAALVASAILCGHSTVGEMNHMGVTEAYDESLKLEYDAIYQEALLRLDMENMNTITNQQINLNGSDVVGTGGCSEIRQVRSIRSRAGRYSMLFNSRKSHLNVTGQADLGEDLTVSLWVKTKRNKRNCSIFNVEINENSFEFVKLPTDPDYGYYVLRSGSGSEPFFEVQVPRKWDWNMFSVTLNNSKICLFQNGLKIGRTSQVGPTWETSCADYTHTGIQNANVSIRLNHPTGCKGVVVDEVAMWTKALNMSELIALRVEPFMDLEPVDVNAEIMKFKRARPMEKSEIMKEISFLDKYDIDRSGARDLRKLTNSETVRELLTNNSLDEETRMNNREAFLRMGNLLIDVSVTRPEISDDIVLSEFIGEMEDTLGDIYFEIDITDETFVFDNIYSTFVNFTDEDEEPEKVLAFPNSSVEISIPKENFKEGGKMAHVMMYQPSANIVLNRDTGPNETILTRVLSLRLPYTENTSLASTINITFDVNITTDFDESLEPFCKYLNLKNSTWLTNGVGMILAENISDDLVRIVCSVSHLTNFAVLLSPVDLEHDLAISLLSYFLVTVSIICLLLTFVVLMSLREIALSQRIQILKNFIVALMVAQLLFVFTSSLLSKTVLCKLAAALSHYFWLAAFTWMLVQGVQLYTKVRRLVGGHIKQRHYVLFAWGVPLPIALIPLIINYVKETELKVCWLPPDLIWFFAIPVIVVFCVNGTVAYLVMKTFLSIKANKDKTESEKIRASVRAVLVMLPVLGLTWFFGLLLLVQPTVEIFQYMFVILNGLQGVLVFLLHLVLNEDVRSAVLKRRNKVAANTENSIFTKTTRAKAAGENESSQTNTSKVPLPSVSTDM